MIGLIALFLFAVWIAVAFLVGRAVATRVTGWRKPIFGLGIAIVVVFSPFLDVIVGYGQFRYYCENAKDWKQYGTIPVGQELYTPEGKWRRDGIVNWNSAESIAEFRRLDRRVESLVRFHWSRAQEPFTVVPITRTQNRVVERNGGRLLAEWTSYRLGPGWLSRHSGLEHSGELCAPVTVWDVYKAVLPFNGSQEPAVSELEPPPKKTAERPRLPIAARPTE